jgi:hypothetical protein
MLGLTGNGRTAFDPAFIGRGWTIISDGNSLTNAPVARLDVSKIKLATTLQDGEKSIKGEEHLLRLRMTGYTSLGAEAFWYLWNRKHLIPECWKEKMNGGTTVYIFFDDTVLGHPNGARHVLCMSWEGGRWNCFTDWLDLDRLRKHLSAVL